MMCNPVAACTHRGSIANSKPPIVDSVSPLQTEDLSPLHEEEESVLPELTEQEFEVPPLPSMSENHRSTEE